MLINKNHSISEFINPTCESIQHENNYQLLQLLLPLQLYKGIFYQSRVPNKPLVQVVVKEVFKYTTEIELSYLFTFGSSEKVVMRLYHDANVAEITYCTDLQQFIRLLGPKITPKTHLKTRSALNVFLNKLMLFLLKSGYNHNHWNQLPSKN